MLNAYVNGKFVSAEEIQINIFDLGLLRGQAVFEYFRTYHKQPLHLNERIQRLLSSAQASAISVVQTFSQIENIVHTLLQNSPYEECTIRMIATGGETEDGFMPLGTGSLFILVKQFQPLPPDLYTKGIRLLTTPLKRSFPSIKSTHYLPALVALKKTQAQDILFINDKNEILEASSANFFGVKGGKLITSNSPDILPGITRKILLSHFPAEQRPIPLEELFSWDEAFTSSSVKEIVPVVAVDGKKIGNGLPGPQTASLIEFYKEYCHTFCLSCARINS